MHFLILLFVFINDIACSPILKSFSNEKKNGSFNEFITAELNYLSYQANKTVLMPVVTKQDKSDQELHSSQTNFKLNLPIKFLTPTKDNKFIEYKLPVIHIGEIFSKKQNHLDSSAESESNYFSNENTPFSSPDYGDKFNSYYLEMQHLVGDLVKKFNLDSHQVYRLIGYYDIYDSSIELEDYELEHLASILSQLVEADRDFDQMANYGEIYSYKKLRDNFVKFYENMVVKNLNKLKILANKIRGNLVSNY